MDRNHDQFVFYDLEEITNEVKVLLAKPGYLESLCKPARGLFLALRSLMCGDSKGHSGVGECSISMDCR